MRINNNNINNTQLNNLKIDTKNNNINLSNTNIKENFVSFNIKNLNPKLLKELIITKNIQTSISLIQVSDESLDKTSKLLKVLKNNYSNIDFKNISDEKIENLSRKTELIKNEIKTIIKETKFEDKEIFKGHSVNFDIPTKKNSIKINLDFINLDKIMDDIKNPTKENLKDILKNNFSTIDETLKDIDFSKKEMTHSKTILETLANKFNESNISTLEKAKKTLNNFKNKLLKDPNERILIKLLNNLGIDKKGSSLSESNIKNDISNNIQNINSKILDIQNNDINISDELNLINDDYNKLDEKNSILDKYNIENNHEENQTRIKRKKDDINEIDTNKISILSTMFNTNQNKEMSKNISIAIYTFVAITGAVFVFSMLK